jgi:hypothetical protein
VSDAGRLRVTYVASSSHSGSTLLALRADEHPLIASVGETAVKPRIRREGRAAQQPCSCGAPLERCEFWTAVFRRVAAAGERLSVDAWTNDYRFETAWLDTLFTRETSLGGLRAIRRWAARRLPGYRERVSRIDRTNVAFVAAVLAQTGATVFFDTTKLVTRLTHLLEVPEMDVRVVHLVRDVRGFVASAKRRGIGVEDAARTWVSDQVSIERVTRRLSADRRMLMRYEDLCTAPETTLARLWAFCGVAPAAGPSPVLRSTDHHVIGNGMRMEGTIEVKLDDRWRTTLASGDEQRILDVAGPLHRRLGYV